MPATMHVYGVYRRDRRVWVRNGRSGERERRKKALYDVRFHVDGHQFRYGLEQKGWADDYASRLRQEFAKGWLFDPAARRFLPVTRPRDETDESLLTFHAHAGDYFARHWYRWQPATRCDAQRVLSLACILLVRDEAAPLPPDQRILADRYLRRAVLAVPAVTDLDAQEREWAGWFAKWSLPLAGVTDGHLRTFIDFTRTETLGGQKRQMAPTTLARSRAIVRAAFTNARKRRLITWDPWDAVEPEPTRDHDQIDPDLVMDPTEIREMARVCGAISPRYEAYVLVQGFCGLRPGEATDLRRRDVNVEGDRPSVTVGGSYTWVPDRFLADGETRRRPLKGRGEKVSRTVPMPAELVPIMRRHLDEFVGGGRDSIVFTNHAGNRIHGSDFRRDVWCKAREAVFEHDSPLRRVRRHDLRHSAITVWLNAGVPLKTAQRWSGHKKLSVLLDTYLGVMRGDEATAIQRLEAALDDEVVTGS